MRQLATAGRIRAFLKRLGESARTPTRLYLTGGATAVLLGWRDSTIGVDVKLVPGSDEVLRAIPRLKEELELNVELASPDMFIPVGEDWESRSPWETTEGQLSVHHFDLVAQALAKIERGHERDLQDLHAMFERALIKPADVRARFDAIESQLHRFPAIDPRSYRRAVEHATADVASDP